MLTKVYFFSQTDLFLVLFLLLLHKNHRNLGENVFKHNSFIFEEAKNVLLLYNFSDIFHKVLKNAGRLVGKIGHPFYSQT